MVLFAALHESVTGTNAISSDVCYLVANGGKADMPRRGRITLTLR